MGRGGRSAEGVQTPSLRERELGEGYTLRQEAAKTPSRSSTPRSTTSRACRSTSPRQVQRHHRRVSGSGKSTLAFDILFNEGQRRYLESLNAYARSIVQPAGRPEVDAVYGIPPTVAIEQRLSRGGRKSTVGTTTEVWHFLRLLYVKLGTQHCVNDGAAVRRRRPTALPRSCMKRYRGQHIGLLAPLVVNRKGVYTELADWARPRGYTHLRVDGELPAHHGLPAHRPLQGTHHRAAGVSPGVTPGERGAAARQACRARWSTARAWCMCCTPLAAAAAS
jgi:excinuclease ABC subunit A